MLATGSGTSYRVDNFQLYNGSNLVMATANDSASNNGYDSMGVYLDIEAPTISQSTLSPFLVDRYDRDGDGSFYDSNEEQNIEFGYNITITAKVIDDMIGVDSDEVKVKISNRTHNNIIDRILLVVAADTYQLDLSDDILPGNYTLSIMAKDGYGQERRKDINMTVVDTFPPTLDVGMPRASAHSAASAEVVHFVNYTVNGTTDPGLNVDISLYDETGFFYKGTQTTQAFSGTSIQVGSYTILKDPRVNTTWYIEGHHESEVNGKYIEFITDGILRREYPRFKITFADNSRNSCPSGLDCTVVILDRPFNIPATTFGSNVYSEEYDTGYFEDTITLEEGINKLKFEVKDANGQESYVFRYIDYNIPLIPLNLLIYNPDASASAPSVAQTVYRNNLIIKGETNAGANITTFIEDTTGSTVFQGSLKVSSDISSQIAEYEFYNHPTTGFNSVDDYTIDVIGDSSGHISTDLVGKYVEFELDGQDYKPRPRYKIEATNNLNYQFTKFARIRLNQPLTTPVTTIGKVYVFDTEYPTGYFNQSVTVAEGLNRLTIYSRDDRGQSVSNMLYVFYNTSADMGLDILEPSRFDASGNRLINTQDFQINQQNIRVSVVTPNFDTTCTIEPVSQYGTEVSNYFSPVAMLSTDYKTHTYIINQSSCIDQDGQYCLVGGNSNYYHFKVDCTSKDYPEITDTITDLCFKVDVVNDQTTGNICDVSSEAYCASNQVGTSCVTVDLCSDGFCSTTDDCTCPNYGDCNQQQCTVADPCSDGTCNVNDDCTCANYGDCTQTQCDPGNLCTDGQCEQADCTSCQGYGDCTESQCGDFDTSI